MKYFISVLFIALLCHNLTEAQTPTYAGLPKPENVLVVYKQPIDENDSLGNISFAIANYYKDARNIPTVNICPLENLTRHDITIGSETHPIIITQVTDVIQDSLNQATGAAATFQ